MDSSKKIYEERSKTLAKYDSNRKKFTKNLHNLNHNVSLYIDGYHFFKNVTEIIHGSNNYVKNKFNEFLRNGFKLKMENDFENSPFLKNFNNQKFDQLKIQRMKRAINSLDEHQTKTNLSIAAKKLINYIQNDIEDTMKANLEKKRPNDKFYNVQDISTKSVDAELAISKNEMINDFQNKTKKRSYKINVNYEIKFFCGDKPNLDKIADQYKRRKDISIFKNKQTYENIKKGITPGFATGRSININTYQDFINDSKHIFGTDKKNIKFAKTKHEWGFNFDTLKFKEKGVDCKIIMEILEDKEKKDNNFICLIANDSDYYPLFDLLNNECSFYTNNLLCKNVPIIFPLTQKRYISKILKKTTWVFKKEIHIPHFLTIYDPTMHDGALMLNKVFPFSFFSYLLFADLSENPEKTIAPVRDPTEIDSNLNHLILENKIRKN